jgi:hypothetical protein
MEEEESDIRMMQWIDRFAQGRVEGEESEITE